MLRFLIFLRAARSERRFQGAASLVKSLRKHKSLSFGNVWGKSISLIVTDAWTFHDSFFESGREGEREKERERRERERERGRIIIDDDERVMCSHLANCLGHSNAFLSVFALEINGHVLEEPNESCWQSQRIKPFSFHPCFFLSPSFPLSFLSLSNQDADCYANGNQDLTKISSYHEDEASNRSCAYG